MEPPSKIFNSCEVVTHSIHIFQLTKDNGIGKPLFPNIKIVFSGEETDLDLLEYLTRKRNSCCASTL